MSSMQERFNQKENRWIKEEYRPFREKYGFWVTIVGVIIMLVIPTVILWLTGEVLGISYIFLLVGFVVFAFGIYMLITSYNTTIRLKEVLKGQLICYEYTGKKTDEKKVFASIGEAETAIENPEAEEKEP